MTCQPYALESWPKHGTMDVPSWAHIMLFWIGHVLAHRARPVSPTIALISVVADYANNELVPKQGTNLEQHV